MILQLIGLLKLISMHLHLLLSQERVTASSDQGNHHRSKHEWHQLRQPYPGMNIQRSERRKSKVIENRRTQHDGEECRHRTPGVLPHSMVDNSTSPGEGI